MALEPNEKSLESREFWELIIHFIRMAAFAGVALCLALAGIWYFQRETYLSNTQQEMVDRILDYVYPGSTMIRADGDILSAPVGSTVYIEVWVTFISPDSFDKIK